MRPRPSGFPVRTALGSWCCPSRGGRLAERPWQRARWQHATFLKVNNETSCEPSEKAAGAEESRRVPGAGEALLQSPAFLAGAHPDPWFSFPQLAIPGEEAEKRWGASRPARGSQMPAIRSSWPCPGDLHSQAPSSKHLSAPHQTASVTWASSCPAIFPMGATGDRLSLPSPIPIPQLGSALTITEAAARRRCNGSSTLALHPHGAARRASQDPEVGRQQDQSSFLESIFTKHGQLARIQPWEE